MSVLTQLIVWLNAAANSLARVALAPLAAAPGWLSATVVGAVSGILMLLVFKYTSNQRAIKRVRSGLKAELLTLKLFKESAAVALRAQGRMLVGAGLLLLYAIVPILVMLVPVTLLFEQVNQWYEAQPLRPGEEAVVTLKLGDAAEAAWPEIYLQPNKAIDVSIGPVRLLSKREVCWNVKACEHGYHRLVFHVDGRPFEKELAIGNGFMRVSKQRPGRHWLDNLEHPWEQPFAPDSPVQSIDIDYPERSSWISGRYWWTYWFLVSMVAALCFRRVLNVNI
ncbi:MAG TPA: hypothetical protein VGY58_04520 [Gemmataceae bacterium]|jgi:hypothetical protein|nr:hypothetical protein [Gemmataceae bacterium]